jgi:hypothetical protein
MVPWGETGMLSIFTVFSIWCGGKDVRREEEVGKMKENQCKKEK